MRVALAVSATMCAPSAAASLWEVGPWLDQLGLGEYTAAFEDAEIALNDVPGLTDRELRDLGLSAHDRRALVDAIPALELALLQREPVALQLPGSDEPESTAHVAEDRTTTDYVELINRSHRIQDSLIASQLHDETVAMSVTNKHQTRASSSFVMSNESNGNLDHVLGFAFSSDLLGRKKQDSLKFTAAYLSGIGGRFETDENEDQRDSDKSQRKARYIHSSNWQGDVLGFVADGEFFGDALELRAEYALARYNTYSDRRSGSPGGAHRFAATYEPQVDWELLGRSFFFELGVDYQAAGRGFRSLANDSVRPGSESLKASGLLEWGEFLVNFNATTGQVDSADDHGFAPTKSNDFEVEVEYAPELGAAFGWLGSPVLAFNYYDYGSSSAGDKDGFGAYDEVDVTEEFLASFDYDRWNWEFEHVRTRFADGVDSSFSQENVRTKLGMSRKIGRRALLSSSFEFGDQTTDEVSTRSNEWSTRLSLEPIHRRLQTTVDYRMGRSAAWGGSEEEDFNRIGVDFRWTARKPVGDRPGVFLTFKGTRREPHGLADRSDDSEALRFLLELKLDYSGN